MARLVGGEAGAGGDAAALIGALAMRLRVLQVTPYYEHAWGYGGIPRVATALSRALARRGHEVTVVTTDARDAEGRIARDPCVDGPGVYRAFRSAGADGVTVEVFPNLSNRLAYRQQFFTPMGGLSSFARRAAARFDIAHVHGCRHLPGVTVAAALARSGVPYVVAPNGTAPLLERRLAAKWVFDRTVGRRLLPEAARVIAVSPSESRRLASLGVPEAKIRMIPNPIDLDEFRAARGGAGVWPQGREGRGLREMFAGGVDHVVLYLGTLSPRKGVETLVRAVAILGARARVGLAIAGNDLGAERRVRAAVREACLGERARFLGLVRGAERAELYRQADVVAYAGRDEAFGLVAFEALFCGTPVVVASDAGCGEWVEELGGGALVPPDDPGRLARAIGAVLGDLPGFRARAGEAARRIPELFGGDAVAREVEALYAGTVRREEERARPCPVMA